MKGVLLIAGIITALSMSVNYAFSSTITYTYTGHGSGDVDGVPFFNEDFTISATADIANRESIGNSIYFIINSTAIINITDVGNLMIISPTRFFVNNQENTVGFSHAGSLPFDLFNTKNSAFESWNMLNSIGPVNGIGALLQWHDLGLDPVLTSEGILFFTDNANVNATFQATVSPIPEPSTYIMLLVGLGFIWLVRRRKNA